MIRKWCYHFISVTEEMKEKGFEITVSRALFITRTDSNSDLFRAPDNFIETLFRLLLSQQ